jgi:hypothetical protein
MYRRHHKNAPKLSADQARTFDRISEASVAEITAAISGRAASGLYPTCHCQPYQDVFTYDRWSAQGCYVRKGEKSLARLVSYAEVKEARDGQEVVKRIPHPYWVFCRCQITTKEGATITPTEVIPAPAPLPTPAPFVEQAEPEPVSVPINVGRRFAVLEV